MSFFSYCSLPDIAYKYSETARFLGEKYGADKGSPCFFHDIAEASDVNDERFLARLNDVTRSMNEAELRRLAFCCNMDMYAAVKFHRESKRKFWYRQVLKFVGFKLSK